MSSYSQAQFPSWAYSGVPAHYGSYSQVNNYPAYLAESMNAYQAHHSRLLNQQMGRTTDSKPRLSKEEVEVLEAEFQKNHKPSSATKKTLAESMRVDTARINNWFQNRRAREKKEKNIREYEAKQKLEKEQAEAKGISVTDDRKKDLVASSAPFPQPCKAEQSTSTSHVNRIDTASEISDAAKSEANSVETTPDLLCDTAFKSDRQGEDSRDHSPVDIPDYLSVSDASGDLPFSDPEVYLANDRSPSQIFSEYQSMMAQNTGVKPNDFFSSSLFLGGQDQLDSLSPTERYDSKLKSPPYIDMAMRRSRRPTPLSISGARAFTQMGPRTAMDLSRVVDNTSFMRRTSSGSGRVAKNVATPRNLFTLNRTPSSNGHSNTTTPPTPDTPLAVNTMNAFTLDKAMMGAYSNQDLTTPPATPGGAEGLFNGYTMGMGEESLVAMGMANSFAMGAGAAYGAASRSTMYAPQMNASYYNMYGNGSEYHSE